MGNVFVKISAFGLIKLVKLPGISNNIYKGKLNLIHIIILCAMAYRVVAALFKMSKMFTRCFDVCFERALAAD